MQDINEGGVQKVFITLVNELSKNNNVALVVLKKSNGFKGLLNSNVELYELNSKKVLYSIPKLISLLWKLKPSFCFSAIVHVNIIVRLLTLLMPFKINHVITEHTNSSNAQMRAERLNLKVAYKLQKCIYKLADLVICVSKGVAKDLNKRIPSLEGKIEVIPNPVIEESIKDFKANYIKKVNSNEKSNILIVARLVPEKGVDYLIESLPFILEEKLVTLNVIGDGPERERLTNLAKRLNVDSYINFLGYQVEPFEYFINADLFALTSKHEGFALVLVEAMYLSKRVISVDCPSGPSEVMDEGRFGRLVPRDTPKKFAKYMLEELSKDEDQDIGKRAEKYDVTNIAKMYMELLDLRFDK